MKAKKTMMLLVATMVVITLTSCEKDSAGTGDAGGGITPAGYVDLGLTSGTKWKATNETKSNDENNFYTYDEALAFGNKLPTKEQFYELRNSCDWTWTGMGYKVVGTNGNYIILPAAGHRHSGSGVYFVGSVGYYWSSTPNGSKHAWNLVFDSCSVDVNSYYGRDFGHSVRLVQN